MHVTFRVCMHVIFRVCMHVTFGNITVAIQIGQKESLLKQVKSPIGAKRTFQIHEDPHELAKESAKDNKWWKENLFMIFFGEKEGGCCVQKTRQVPLD